MREEPVPNRFIYFILLPCLLMSLGWGLRGYIGGGPLGAMIPGAFIALWLCMLLGIETHRAALVAIFSAIGVGFGGEMTYGQTIGFIKQQDTLLWGLLGLTLKGAVWGLLGGVMIGLGLVAHRLTQRQALWCLGLFLLATFAGIAFINEPRLIYFSDRVNKPRAEVWAGLLLGAVALLLVLQRVGVARAPLRYALYGLPWGAIGFGGGGAIHALGFHYADAYGDFPWWKAMEFFFGACLGVGYGACAMATPDDEQVGAVTPKEGGAPWQTFAGAVVLVTVGLLVWNWAAESLIEAVPAHPIAMPLARVLFGFTTLGVVLCLLALRHEAAAWQTTITITFVATVIDLQEDMAELENFLALPAVRLAIVVISMAVCAALVTQWQRDPRRRLSSLLFWLMWACVAVAFARVFVEVVAVLPAAAGDPRPWHLLALHEMARHWLVHGGFLAMAVAVTVGLLRFSRQHAALNQP